MAAPTSFACAPEVLTPEDSVWVCLDDTDSPRGGCTTYVAHVLIERLEDEGIEASGPPFLVRLNPNVPRKTRGNAAVVVPVDPDADPDRVAELTEIVINDLADPGHPSTDPGVLVCHGIPEGVEGLYFEALRRVLSPSSIEIPDGIHVVREGHGIIGALAALGFASLAVRGLVEVTYEGIAYRSSSAWGKERRVDGRSVEEMDSLTFPVTFDNVDGRGMILITPNTPCPVLYGVRAVEPWILRVVPHLLRSEPVMGYRVFATNQATDAHLERVGTLGEAVDFSNVVIDLVVVGEPKRIRGGHVVVRCEDDEGETVDVAAFRPAAPMTEVVASLVPGDVIRVAGALKPETPKHPRTVNVEKLMVLELERVEEVRNPVCGRCGVTMKSSGRERGFRCRRCGDSVGEGEAVRLEVPRDVAEGAIYEVPPVARRHLSKPEYLVDLGLLSSSPIRDGETGLCRGFSGR